MWFDCLHVVRIYSFMKEIKVNIRASYIVCLFGKENNNFIIEIKQVSRVFTDLFSNSHIRFNQAMKAWGTRFIS